MLTVRALGLLLGQALSSSMLLSSIKQGPPLTACSCCGESVGPRVQGGGWARAMGYGSEVQRDFSCWTVEDARDLQALPPFHTE